MKKTLILTALLACSTCLPSDEQPKSPTAWEKIYAVLNGAGYVASSIGQVFR